MNARTLALARQSSSLWRQADFLKLWIGQTVSLFGSRVTVLALPLTAILALHATPMQMGLLIAVQAAPSLIVGLPAGVAVDRLRRRPIMIAADVGRSLLLLSIPIAARMHMLHMVHVYVVAFLVGVLTVFFDVAYMALLPTMVRREQLVDGNSKLQLSESAAQVAGPGMGGALVQALTAPVALLADAISFVLSALSLTLIRAPEPAPPRQGDSSVRTDLREGVSALARHPLLRPLAAAAATFNLFDNMLFAVYVLYMTHDLHLGAGAVGLVFGLGGAGGFAAASLVSRLTRRLGLGRTVLLGIVLASLAELVIAGAKGSIASAFVILVVAETVVEFGATLYGINATSLRQAITPDRLQGRVNATTRTLVMGIGLAGALAGGTLGQMIGLQRTVLVAGLGTLSAFLWIALSAVRFAR